MTTTTSVQFSVESSVYATQAAIGVSIVLELLFESDGRWFSSGRSACAMNSTVEFTIPCQDLHQSVPVILRVDDVGLAWQGLAIPGNVMLLRVVRDGASGAWKVAPLTSPPPACRPSSTLDVSSEDDVARNVRDPLSLLESSIHHEDVRFALLGLIQKAEDVGGRLSVVALHTTLQLPAGSLDQMRARVSAAERRALLLWRGALLLSLHSRRGVNDII